MPMKTVDWYFDFLSPFSYLQGTQLARIESLATVRRRPVLFAGLLRHWGQLGPAEVPPKRTWTFRHAVWLAERLGVPIRMPTMHPFNPLPLLRLSIALGDTPTVVDRLFAFVWRQGHVPTDAAAWQALLDECGPAASRLDGPEVKAVLREHGEAAIATGVFGVPTAVVDGLVFWGLDATDMLIDYLRGSPLFAGDAMRQAIAMPQGPGRTLPGLPNQPLR